MKAAFEASAATCHWLSIAILSVVALAPLNAQDEKGTRSSLKVTAPSVPGSSLEGEPSGVTFVALSPGLENVFRGREPASLAELKALESQQARVAQVIERVTVNVQQGAAQGSGVIINEDGYVLTAAHVAGGADRYAQVVLSDGTAVEARTLGMNRDKDAGLLKIVGQPGRKWPFATPGRSSELHDGQWVVAAGHPGGWKPQRGPVIRVGRVLKISSGPVRRGSRDRSAHTLFTDCALIGGDSGGPLFTLEGKLVGVHSRIGTDVEDNMHVPIDVFADSWHRMARKEVWGVLPGYQPVIGVKGAAADERPLIASVVPGGPAQRGGIAVGDVVLSVDGVEITTFEELRLSVEARMPGDTMVLIILRDNQKLRLPVVVGAAPLPQSYP